MRRVDIAVEFYRRLANRNERQGDGTHNAIAFRERFLKHLDTQAAWANPRPEDRTILNFAGVKKIGPSFANEAFGYFMKYCKPTEFLAVVQIENASVVQEQIIREELESGYQGR